ncbi:MAG: DUF5694 domain-containing protein [Gemmatimonadales bacterium]
MLGDRGLAHRERLGQQQLTSSTRGRILVIVGAGHLPILRFLAQSSPEHRLIEVSDYLKNSDSGAPVELSSRAPNKRCSSQSLFCSALRAQFVKCACS